MEFSGSQGCSLKLKKLVQCCQTFEGLEEAGYYVQQVYGHQYIKPHSSHDTISSKSSFSNNFCSVLWFPHKSLALLTCHYFAEISQENVAKMINLDENLCCKSDRINE